MALSATPLLRSWLRMSAVLLALSLQAIWAAPRLNVLQWNPHWQCFVWDQQDCKGEAESRVKQWLPALDLDFANLIEFDDKNFTLPSGWSALNTTCGRDLVSLVYNDLRWRATSSNGSTAVGCMVAADQPSGPDRPVVVQHFERIGSPLAFDRNMTDIYSAAGITGKANGESANATNSTNATAGVPSSVIVIGAHFPHPDYIGGPLRDEQFAILRTLLQSMINSTGTQDVILIADTNLYRNTPSASIANSSGMPGSNIVATSLERTCCFDVDYPPTLTFDRVIANFGVDMMTKVLIEEPLPIWAQQVKGARKGAFHKPVEGVILWERLPRSSPRTTPPGSHHKIWMIVLAVVAAAAAVGLAALLLFRKRSGGEKEVGLCDESDEDDSDTEKSE